MTKEQKEAKALEDANAIRLAEEEAAEKIRIEQAEVDALEATKAAEAAQEAKEAEDARLAQEAQEAKEAEDARSKGKCEFCGSTNVTRRDSGLIVCSDCNNIDRSGMEEA